jgi:hypothetical protein
MPGGKKNGFSIVDGAAGRKVFPGVVPVKTNEVRYLFTFNINYHQLLSFIQRESHAATRWDYI